ncbi:MAG TPA: Rrf2 family transcriptional regulator, partial [Elusimicrobiota bacterium]|nr:Rrf2 family transcriptional regulator [Elusimicrobiota bacterium]
GGSRLARSPARVTLWDLCVALEEEHLFAVHRNAENPLCPVSCRMKRALAAVFADVERAARRRLAAVTIAELLEDCAP